jgi:hypothetical protein
MGDACARRESGQITWPHTMNVPVDPGVDLSSQNVDELLFVLLGVWPRGACPRWQSLEVDPDSRQSCLHAEYTNWTHRFVALRVDVCVFRDFAC